MAGVVGLKPDHDNLRPSQFQGGRLRGDPAPWGFKLGRNLCALLGKPGLAPKLSSICCWELQDGFHLPTLFISVWYPGFLSIGGGVALPGQSHFAQLDELATTCSTPILPGRSQCL